VDADLLVQVVDASSHALKDHLRTTEATLEELGLADRPRLLVFNKIDRTPPGVIERLRIDHPDSVFVSALDALIEETVCIPSGEPGLLARLCTLVRVIHSAVVDGHVEVRFHARPSQMAQIAQLLQSTGVGMSLGAGKHS
jgi:GTP-binding protein HflX